jgi:hypothetical protein
MVTVSEPSYVRNQDDDGVDDDDLGSPSRRGEVTKMWPRRVLVSVGIALGSIVAMAIPVHAEEDEAPVQADENEQHTATITGAYGIGQYTERGWSHELQGYVDDTDPDDGSCAELWLDFSAVWGHHDAVLTYACDGGEGWGPVVSDGSVLVYSYRMAICVARSVTDEPTRCHSPDGSPTEWPVLSFEAGTNEHHEASEPDHPNQEPGGTCGNVRTAGGVVAPVAVRSGQVSCEEALGVVQTYFEQLSTGGGQGNGGGGEIEVRGWTCSSGPATDPGTVCRASQGREVAVIIT